MLSCKIQDSIATHGCNHDYIIGKTLLLAAQRVKLAIEFLSFQPSWRVIDQSEGSLMERSDTWLNLIRMGGWITREAIRENKESVAKQDVGRK